MLLTLCLSSFCLSLQAKEENDKKQDGNDNTNKRVSFITGLGASYITTVLYKEPVIHKPTNNVILEKAWPGKLNFSLGIAYTPYLKTITNSEGSFVTPHGITFASFFNPFNLNNASSDISTLDFGAGIGWKFAAGIMILGTVDFFSIKQPTNYFVTMYKNNDKQYLINNVAQPALDLSDKSIMQNKMAISFGFKICYTFDLVNSYRAATGKTD